MSNEKKQSFMGGVTILAISTIFVKVCGALYKIPLGNILGEEGMTHFMSAYRIYTLLLTLSTTGLPLALSKLISEANAAGRKNQVKRCFRTALGLFAALGIIGTTAMLVFAEQLAGWMNNPSAAWPIRALGISVICVSIMCAYRGYAQGRQNMVPTAVSQFLEAFFKLIVGLPLAWLLISAGHGQHIGAAGAIIGVSVGIVIAMIFMILEQRKNRDRDLRATDTPDSHSSILLRLLSLGIPITIGQAGMSLLNLLDQKIIMGELQKITAASLSAAEQVGMTGAEISAKVEKIAAELYGEYTLSEVFFNLPSTFLAAIAISLIPAISAAITRKEHHEVNRVVTTSFRLIAILALPVGAGMSVMAGPILQLLYPGKAADPYHLQLLGIASIFVCIMLLTNSIMQAHGRVYLPIITMLIGGTIKIITNYTLVGNPEINIKGAPIGALVCYGLVALINLIIVYRMLEKKPNYLGIFFKPVLATAVMAASAWASYGLISRVFSGSYLSLAISAMGAIGIAVVVYFVLVIALRMITAEDLKMVPKGDKIARLLHIR